MQTQVSVDSCPFTTMKFVFRAFIPGHIPNVTKKLKNGIETLPAPTGQYFHTDQRSFSNDMNASARCITTINLTFDRKSKTMTNVTDSSTCLPTIEYDENGRVLKTATASPDVSERKESVENGHYRLFFSVDATNPLIQLGFIPISSLTPAISYKITLFVRQSYIMYLVRHDSFPAHEAVVEIDGRVGGVYQSANPTNPNDLFGTGWDNPSMGVLEFAAFPKQIPDRWFRTITLKEQIQLLRRER